MAGLTSSGEILEEENVKKQSVIEYSWKNLKRNMIFGESCRICSPKLFVLSIFSPSCSCHRRHTRLPAAFAQLGPGPEHRDGGVPGHHAEPVVAARGRDHPQEGGPTDEKQVGAGASSRTSSK